MGTSTSRAAAGARGKRRRRKAPPKDWLDYLAPLAEEIVVAVEIACRLRWAYELKVQGLRIAPFSAGIYRARLQLTKRLPHDISGNPLPPGIVKNLESPSDILARLLSPEEMAEILSLADLRSLRDTWNVEIKEWAEAIWSKRGEVVRLRAKRRSLLDKINIVREFTKSDAEAAALVENAEAQPGVTITSRSGANFFVSFGYLDAFGNSIPEEVDAETLEELAQPPHDERATRRILKGGLKLAQGGVRDIDRRLLRGQSPDE